MSIFVSDFSADPWTVTHDDARGGAHEGTVPSTDITHASGIDGNPNFQSINVTCPVCGASSSHPVGGGAQPPLVQEMFVRVVMRDGCPCPANYAAGRPFQLTLSHVRTHTLQQDGDGRWQVGQEVIAA